MAGAAKKAKVIDKWRKKRYFSIFAPKVFQERELGQTMAYGPEEMMGRKIEVNLMILTGNVKKQHINVSFRVNSLRGEQAHTIVDTYEIAPAAVKRKVRRMRDKLDGSFTLITSDKQKVRLKPLIITGTKVSQAVRAAVRVDSTKFMTNYVGTVDYETLVTDMITEKFQKEIRNAINKITPIRSVDIRIMKYAGVSDTAPVLEELKKPVRKVEPVEAEQPVEEAQA
jgi:small subunit ribosomal protein S3Ae